MASSVVNRRKGRKKKKINAPGGDISIARVLDRQCAGHGGVAQLSRYANKRVGSADEIGETRETAIIYYSRLNRV